MAIDLCNKSERARAADRGAWEENFASGDAAVALDELWPEQRETLDVGYRSATRSTAPRSGSTPARATSCARRC